MNSENYPNERLVELLKGTIQEQNKAIEYLLGLQKLVTFIRKTVIDFGGSEPDTDDVLNESLMILIRNVQKDTFRGDSQLTSYWVAIAKRLCLSKFRKATKMETRDPADLPQPLEKVPQVDESIIQMERQKEHAQVMRQLYKKLSETCIRVLEMYMHHYSREEMSEEMGWANTQTAGNKVVECKKKLRKLIEEDPKIMGIIRSRL